VRDVAPNTSQLGGPLARPPPRRLTIRSLPFLTGGTSADALSPPPPAHRGCCIFPLLAFWAYSPISIRAPQTRQRPPCFDTKDGAIRLVARPRPSRLPCGIQSFERVPQRHGPSSRWWVRPKERRSPVLERVLMERLRRAMSCSRHQSLRTFSGGANATSHDTFAPPEPWRPVGGSRMRYCSRDLGGAVRWFAQ
jgi:hypothetical protein